MTNYFQSGLLKSRAALVTGGGTGICRGIALALASAGCDVAITTRKQEHLEPAVEDLQRTGVRAVAIAGDVRDPSAVEAVVSKTAEAFGRLDILVNGAAGNFVCLAENLSPNGFGTVVDIDLKGTFHVSRRAVPALESARRRRAEHQRDAAVAGNRRPEPRVGGEGRRRCAHARPRGGVGTGGHP